MNIKPILKLTIYTLSLIILTGLAGCSGTYGSFKRDKQVFEAFENNQVSKDYKYLYNGQHNQTYAILGIDPKYRLESKFWREVGPNTEEFRKLISRIWEDYNFYTYGANILDPTGTKMGIWYSSVYIATVKFVGENEIEVMMETPWLWGPDGGGGGGPRSP